MSVNLHIIIIITTAITNTFHYFLLTGYFPELLWISPDLPKVIFFGTGEAIFLQIRYCSCCPTNRSKAIRQINKLIYYYF